MSEARFAVGDRVRFSGYPGGEQVTVTSVEFAYHYERANGSQWHELESNLELAPPSPRATVTEQKEVYGSRSWSVSCDGEIRYYSRREYAEAIAALLNANPSWSL